MRNANSAVLVLFLYYLTGLEYIGCRSWIGVLWIDIQYHSRNRRTCARKRIGFLSLGQF